MGQQVGSLGLSYGGAALGSFFGPVGTAIGGLAGGLIASFIFNKQGKPMIPDVGLMSSAYGRPIPFFYGTDRFPGMMIWTDKIQTHKHGVGKGIGGQSTYSYTQSAAIAFAQGPATLLKVFADGKLIWDTTQANPFTSKIRFVARVYTGTDDQLPDPAIQAWVAAHVSPPDACPAYRGLCYIVFDALDLAHFGNRFPQIQAIWSSNATTTTVFKTLELFADDDGGNLYALPSGNEQSGTGVDWVRMQVYGLTNADADDNQRLRVFDIQSGQQIQEANLNDILTEGEVTEFEPYHNLIGLLVGQGSYLYLYNSVSNTIVTLNADTLKVVRKVTFDSPTGGLFSNPTGIYAPVVFPISTPLGTQDMIVGFMNFAGPIVINPISGTSSDSLDLAHKNIFTFMDMQVGNNDLVEGVVDLWIYVYQLGDGTAGHKTNGFHLYRVQVTSPDPSALTVLGGLTEVGNYNGFDFGLPTDGGYANAAFPGLRYSPSDDTLVMSVWGAVAKVNFTTGLVALLTATEPAGWRADNYAVNDRGFAPMAISGNTWHDIDLLSGSAEQSPAPTTYAPSSWVVGSSSYSNAVIFKDVATTDDLMIAYLRRTDGPDYPIADIITDLCARVGITSDMIDVTLVTDTVTGYTVAEPKSAGAALSDILHTFQIDMTESDYTLKFVPRGQASVATITQDDLASIDEQDASQFWQEKRAQQQELPQQINLRYTDPALDYLPGATYAKRVALPVPTVESKRKQSIDLPIRADASEARAIAERWLYTLWAERDTYETRTGVKYLWLDPTDNVTVNLDSGDSYTVRIESTEFAADMSMHLNLASEDRTTYTSPGTPGAVYGNPPQVIVGAPFGALLQWNSPLLRDANDTAGISTRIYFAVGAYAAGWTTGTLYRSTDGATWEQFSTLSQSVDWGHALNALGDTVNSFSTDYLNTVTIALQSGSSPLVSCTYDQMLSGANAALLGDEIIQYKTVTDNGDGTYTLSGILRGRRGTEWAIGGHASGDTFIVLVVGDIGGSILTLAEIGVSEQWRLVPSGRFLEEVPAVTFTYTGDDLKPYAPVHMERANSGSPPDLILTWTRRTRLDGYFLDGTDTAPLFEASESYEAYVLADEAALDTFDPTDALTYVRAFTGLTSPTCTYTAAMMATDSFVPATDTLYLGVYQRSAAIGRGYLGFKALPAF